ncbi:MAG TPA: 2-amino-4-hydroxy-6-hydroxymethyldihydropteridine diphosphokinase [Gammaproteobacteria bacterium]|nr:2-amino-4-hydroxy-6-hydroxymethyldihydropteridine diphosphokinase [Gammaproteobacteria bacterium]
MTHVYVSVGSNIERDHNIRSGLEALRERFGGLALSSVYESEAYGFEGDNFYNLVVGFATDEDVHGVARALQDIEDRHGRVRSGPRYSSRTLDLDLLVYDDLQLHEPGLVLPRPDILKRAFVLGPLAEIAGALKHPVAGKTYAELWSAFDKSQHSIWRVIMEGVV